MQFSQRIPFFLVLALSLCSAPAWSHGKQTHADTLVRFEQQPWGIAGQAAQVRQTVRINLLDTMRFAPSELNVKLGETVRLVVTNQGKVMHEFVLGTPETLKEHAALMKRFPNMEHDEPYMAHVPPGQSVTLIWQFNRAGDFGFACLLPGHFEAGMVGQLRVKP